MPPPSAPSSLCRRNLEVPSKPSHSPAPSQPPAAPTTPSKSTTSPPPPKSAPSTTPPPSPPSSSSPPSLSFPRNLISADDQGAVSLYDADPFLHLKTLKVHRKAVNSIAVHPSGRIGLSVGRDACLAMVNLVRGRKSFYCSLGKEAGIVGYCEGGGEVLFGDG